MRKVNPVETLLLGLALAVGSSNAAVGESTKTEKVTFTVASLPCVDENLQFSLSNSPFDPTDDPTPGSTYNSPAIEPEIVNGFDCSTNSEIQVNSLQIVTDQWKYFENKFFLNRPVYELPVTSGNWRLLTSNQLRQRLITGGITCDAQVAAMNFDFRKVPFTSSFLFPENQGSTTCSGETQEIRATFPVPSGESQIGREYSQSITITAVIS